MEHVAILQQKYLAPLLEGAKTIESRLTVTRREPWNSLRPGHRIYFKASGGGFAARATAGEVLRFVLPVEISIGELRRRFGRAICAPDAYWDLKSGSRYALLVRLHSVNAVQEGPGWRMRPGDRSAWRVAPRVA